MGKIVRASVYVCVCIVCMYDYDDRIVRFINVASKQNIICAELSQGTSQGIR